MRDERERERDLRHMPLKRFRRRFSRGCARPPRIPEGVRSGRHRRDTVLVLIQERRAAGPEQVRVAGLECCRHKLPLSQSASRLEIEMEWIPIKGPPLRS